MKEIKVFKTQDPKEKPQEKDLAFGNVFTDHMFVMDYSVEKGWHDGRIIPYGPIEFEPSTMVFHYGQAIFEGMKAYKNKEGNAVIFRPYDGFLRLNRSAERLCIPTIDPDFACAALKKLIDLERDWIPKSKGTALYIRPFIISTDNFIGVRPSNTYKFFIILSPVGAYYTEGFKPVKIYVTDKYVRAVRGGTGAAKTPGNYAASLYAAKMAQDKGYTQVLWLDGCEHRYVEEVGTMNIFFKIDGRLITPTLDTGSILPGITRDSVIKMAKNLGYEVEERLISIDEVFKAHDDGKLEEVFGTGTAAVISPVGILAWKDREILVNDGKMGKTSKELYENITGIQYGIIDDSFGWIEEV